MRGTFYLVTIIPNLVCDGRIRYETLYSGVLPAQWGMLESRTLLLRNPIGNPWGDMNVTWRALLLSQIARLTMVD
jgi:hypothetical protein